jgi:hypothetical protein
MADDDEEERTTDELMVLMNTYFEIFEKSINNTAQ